MKLVLELLLAVCLLVGCGFAADLLPGQILNLDGSKNWKLMATADSGATTLQYGKGMNATTVGSLFVLDPPGTANMLVYRVTAVADSTVTFTPALNNPFTLGTAITFLPDLSTFKSACDDPGDITKVTVCAQTATAGTLEVRLARDANRNVERWVCEGGCDASGVGQANTNTIHKLVVDKLFPRLDNMGSNDCFDAGVGGKQSCLDAYYDYYATSKRASDGKIATLGHFADMGDSGIWPSLLTKEADPNAPFSWTLYSLGARSFDRTKSGGKPNDLIVQFYAAHIAGPFASDMYLSYFDIDGTPCRVTSTGITGCSAKLSAQLICSSTYVAANSSTNYLDTNQNVDGHLGCWGSGDHAAQGMARVGLSGTYGIRIVGNSGSTAGSHKFTVKFQATDKSIKPLGSAVSITYPFTLNAEPTAIATSPPSSFSTPYNYNNVFGTYLYQSTQYCSIRSDSDGALAANGHWPLNYNVLDRSAYFYDGIRMYQALADTIRPVAGVTAWQPSTNYVYGTLVSPAVEKNAGKFVYFAYNGATPITPSGFSASFTSGTTEPTWNQTVGSTTTDAKGGKWYNAGNVAYYNKCTENVADPYRNWTNLNQGSDMWEYSATLNYGLEMMYWRTGDQKCQGDSSDGCANGTVLPAGYKTALAVSSIPGGNPQPHFRPYKSIIREDHYAVRVYFTAIDWQVAYELVAGRPARDGTLLERVESLKDMMQQVVDFAGYGWEDNTSNSFAVGDLPKPWMDGLALEALINFYQMQVREIPQGEVPDESIPPLVGRVLKVLYEKAYNPTANSTCLDIASYHDGVRCAMAYVLGSYPPVAPAFDFQAPELSQLVASEYAWYWAVVGDTQTMSDGHTYRDVANFLFGSIASMPENFYAPKAVGQQRDWLNTVNWLNGTWRLTTKNGHWYVPNQIDAEQNPCLDGSAFPCSKGAALGDTDLPEPFRVNHQTANGDWRSDNFNVIVGSTTADVQFSTHEPATNAAVLYGSGTSCTNLTKTSPSATEQQIGAYQFDQVAHITGLLAGTTYCYKVQVTDAAGNVATSNVRSSHTGTNNTFTTLASGTD